MQKDYIKIINWIHTFDKKSTQQKVQVLQELPPAVINELMKWKPIVDSPDVLHIQESVPMRFMLIRCRNRWHGTDVVVDCILRFTLYIL